MPNYWHGIKDNGWKKGLEIMIKKGNTDPN
jgi:hypothetical protein